MIFLGGSRILVLSGLMTGSGHGFLFPSLNALAVRQASIEIRGKVILAPMVNTLAFEARWTHGNPVDYRDLTSCYVSEIPRGGSGVPLISYQVARTFYNEVLSKADYRLNLHGGDLEEDLNESITYRKTGTDAEIDAASFDLARNFGWKWIRESLPRPSRRASRQRLPMPLSVSTEAGGMGRCQHDIVDRTFKGVLNVMKHLNMLEGKPDIPSTAKVYNTYLLYAKRGGFFISYVRAGDIISEGDVIGVIKNLFGETLEEIVVPTDGIIDMITSPAIYEGDVVFGIGKNIRTVS